jgi:Stage II sporulation protein E (SpoIIE)
VSAYLDIYSESLNKQGEELCGDTVRTYRNAHSSILVLSDGLGSGVKANILATITSEILLTMLKENVSLSDAIATMIGTLPVCQDRKAAYATFTVVRFNHETSAFKVYNFENPPVMLFRHGKLATLHRRAEQVCDRRIMTTEGVLENGDFLGVVSDGVLHAGPGNEMNMNWGWDQFATHVEHCFLQGPANARFVVHNSLARTRELYAGNVRDDATFLGAFLRQVRPLMVFTGPPLDRSKDAVYVRKLLDFAGRRIVCGGTTAEMVATRAGEMIESDMTTMRDDVPPVGYMHSVDLVTEGILTLARTLDVLNSHVERGEDLPTDRNAAVLLAREFLQADTIHFIVGDTVNPYYQNPQLPRNVSIRRALVEQIAAVLRGRNKEVVIEHC